MAEPFPLAPAYRFGSMTPWGGSGLKTLFHKDIPDPRTGESLEMSVIPSLESRAPDGRTLDAVLAVDPENLLGIWAGRPFPLLLKLIDARESLSVQVHPDDAYAAAVEGKQGKTEAWVILRAEESAQLVMGTAPGIHKADLEAACREGGTALERCLHRVPVQAGDVYYIPSGMLHAIGSGITLYEIQQSSDVTYRFYDWDRRGPDGKGRTLHIRQGLDTVRPELDAHRAVPKIIQSPDGIREKLLRTPFFHLDRWRVCRNRLLQCDAKDTFGVLTAIEPGFLRWQGGELPLREGQSVFLPARRGDVWMTGGHFLVSVPAGEG